VSLKIRIRGPEGELTERAEDVVRVIEQISGRSLLKAELPHDHKPSEFEYPALRGAMTASRKHAERIRQVMDRKIAAVLAQVK
jgi:hypothetical protein